MKKKHILLVIGLLLLVLSGARILWMNAFHNSFNLPIKNGQLELQDWHSQEEDVLLLDGEWEFYPSQWLIDDEQHSSVDKETKKLVQVPGKWDEDFQDGRSTPYGYGSYRLRLYVDPQGKINYSLYVPSVRSSSEVYVNGRFLAGSGQVGKTKDDYNAKNIPYSTTFIADENGLIEIVIQAANFKDIRRSGIIRPVKFGTEAAIAKERNLSLVMQTSALVIFLLHSMYALVLFFLGNRNKKLLYFSLLLFCITLMNGISNDGKIVQLIFNTGYDWDFSLSNAVTLIACYAVLQCFDHPRSAYWRIAVPLYSVINIGLALITLFLSPTHIIMLFPVYYVVAGLTLATVIITIIKKLYADLTGNILLLFSLITITHHFVWNNYWREAGISVIHYPFDLVISIGCFASIWFKNYFTMHAETEKLALQLQKTNEHKIQFLANTSHEFKNPLHGIINMSQSVLNRERHLLGNKSVHELETILTVGQRMSLLLNDLLDVASLEEGRPLLQKKRIAIQPIVSGVMDMLHYLVDVKPLKIINQIPEDLPPVIADENRVIQVIYNLLHNAVKFTNEGEIYIQASVKDERAMITISDSGLGMDEDFLNRLFHPYEQRSDQTMIESGFGLGLSISKQLIELHGGELEVSSTLGEGSKFTFSLKLATGDGDALATKDQSVPSQKVPATHLTELALALTDVEIEVAADQMTLMKTDSGRMPILIVDDDPVNLQVLQSILSGEQYEITTALSGKEALHKLNGKEWNLVISDIMMPQMSGYELTKKIRDRYSFTELPILLLTARSEPKDIQTGFLAGANDYVTKPVEMLELQARVRALATAKTAMREQLQLEAAWLQAQIQPHFLFNTLNSIISLSTVDPNKMNDLLMELSEYLRSKFQFQHFDELIPIQEELKIVRSYLNIEQVRYGNRLKVDWIVNGHENLKIPFLTIQPLVENAIRHGIMKRITGGKISIMVSVHEGFAEISIEDDGVGMDAKQLQGLLERKEGGRTSIGLINTNQRLKRHFGNGLQIKSTPNQGTIVSFIVKI